jgi:hypothetical protein
LKNEIVLIFWQRKEIVLENKNVSWTRLQDTRKCMINVDGIIDNSFFLLGTRHSWVMMMEIKSFLCSIPNLKKKFVRRCYDSRDLRKCQTQNKVK